MNSESFIKVAVAGQILKLRVTPRFKWRRAIIENPAWLNDDRDTDLRLACLIWCMLDGEYKTIQSVQDSFALITDENRTELWRAAHEAWELAYPKAESKNESSSTSAPAPLSS